MEKTNRDCFNLRWRSGIYFNFCWVFSAKPLILSKDLWIHGCTFADSTVLPQLTACVGGTKPTHNLLTHRGSFFQGV
jgi:hypothetical protein